MTKLSSAAAWGLVFMGRWRRRPRAAPARAGTCVDSPRAGAHGVCGRRCARSLLRGVSRRRTGDHPRAARARARRLRQPARHAGLERAPQDRRRALGTALGRTTRHPGPAHRAQGDIVGPATPRSPNPTTSRSACSTTAFGFRYEFNQIAASRDVAVARRTDRVQPRGRFRRLVVSGAQSRPRRISLPPLAAVRW